jgi:nucleoside-diphosphate-sugar epimerase
MPASTIVITGASGFIGSTLAERLAARRPDCRIVGIARHPGPLATLVAPNVEWVAGDLLVPDATARWPRRAETVIHLAADKRPRVPPADSSRQVAVNVLGTSVVADYVAAAGARTVIFASSSAVYSGSCRVPFVEDDVPLPLEHLGATKLAAEGLLKARAMAGQFTAVALRLFTTYGPRSSPEQFIPEVIAKLLSADPVARFEYPDAERDFVFVEDVVTAFLAALELAPRAEPFEVFNIGSGQRVSVRVVVEMLQQLLGTQKPVRYAVASPGVMDPCHQADTHRAAARLGWRATVGLEEGLRRTIEALRPQDVAASA